jgi:two-component system, sensor histidine kinase and response regulator
MIDIQKAIAIAFAQASIPMAILDCAGMPVVANTAFKRSFERITGRSLGSLEKPMLEAFRDRKGSDELSIAFDHLISRGDPVASVDSPIESANGSDAWLRFDMSPVRLLAPANDTASCDSDNNDVLVFCVLSDISELKSKEQSLVAAKDEAERATNTKSQFLANMSHEIRTPIQTITGMTELLLETELDSEQKEYATQVQFSADVLLSLINDILDFSKIEAGRLTLEIIDFDLHSVLEQAVDLVVLDAHKKGLEVLVDLDASVPHSVRGDPLRLRQILVNLVKNSVKFTKVGEIEVFASVRIIEGRESLYFSIRDTGIGISQEARKRLFSAFSQADSSTTRQFGGTGLGLSIAKHLVEQMGGEIGIGTGDGPGSVFWFAIPCTRSESQPQDSTPSFPNRPRVLIADDNSGSRRILRTYLETAGCEVAETSDGPEALEALASAAREGRPFASCLVDLIMPGMDGWRLAAEVNANVAINATKLVLMSPQGTAQVEAKMKLLRWFTSYLSKPIKRREFYECMSRVLGNVIDLETIDEQEVNVEPTEPIAVVAHKVLLAEDHPINQQLFTVILNKLGHEVKVASDGQEAVEFAEDEAFDIIFLDIQMPRMNGYEAATAIRAAGVKVPVVALTASAIKGERERCITAGMNDILTKPFKKKDIQDMLDKWLESGEESHAHGTLETIAPVSETAEPRAIPDSVVLDLPEAVETFLGNRDMVLSLLDKFVEKTALRLVEVDREFAEGDLDAIEREVHSIKGSAWNLSAKATGDAAQAVDEAAKAQNRAGVAATLPMLKAAFADLEAAVAVHTGKPTSAATKKNGA